MSRLWALLVALALLGVSGCAWHTVKITTNVFELPEHEQTAMVDVTTDDTETLTEMDLSSTFGGSAKDNAAKGVGIYVHAGGRTLAVAGPVDMRIACRTFGKNSNIVIVWGGMSYVCEGGHLSEASARLFGEITRGAVAGFTGSPLGATGALSEALGPAEAP